MKRSADELRIRRCWPVLEAVECILAANRLDDAGLREFATRAKYPDAAWTLIHVVCPVALLGPPQNLIESLCDTANLTIAPYRFARAIGALEYTENRFVSYETICADRQNSESARTVLALIGEINWQTASRRERAAFALRQLVHAFRNRPST